MSFRIRGRSQLDDSNQCEENQSTVQNINEIDNSSNNDNEILKNNKTHKFNHKNLEVDYGQLLNSKNKDFRPIINLCDYEQSIALVCGKINGIESTMLLDTVLSISAITENFAQQLKLESWYTDDVLVVTLANTRVKSIENVNVLLTLKLVILMVVKNLMFYLDKFTM